MPSNFIHNSQLNLNLPSIGLGTSGYGGYFNRQSFGVSNKKYIELIELAFDLGVRVIDTAESYADGASEEIIGLLPESIKSNLFIISKFSPENSSREKIISSLDRTLQRLKRDFVDLYMPHWPSSLSTTNLLIETLLELKTQGKIKFLGLSNFTASQFTEFNFLGNNNFKFVEMEYSPCERFIEDVYLPKIIDSQGVLIAYSPFRNGEIINPNSSFYEKLTNIANIFSISIAQLILLWIIRTGSVIAIPKSSSKERLIDNLQALKIKVPEDALHMVSDLFKLDLIMLDTKFIEMEPDGDRVIYYSLNDAIKNKQRLFPGPFEIMEEIKSNGGELVKPIKVKKKLHSNKYIVCEGRLKYWAWLMLYGSSKKIPSIIIN
jgi:diketogulonate reductase-like aldo/keto reductase